MVIMVMYTQLNVLAYQGECTCEVVSYTSIRLLTMYVQENVICTRVLVECTRICSVHTREQVLYLFTYL